MSRMDRDFVVSQFTRYVQGFDQKEEGVRLKVCSFFAGERLCEQIATEVLDLSQDDVDLAVAHRRPPRILADLSSCGSIIRSSIIVHGPCQIRGPVTCLLTAISAIFWTI